MKFCQSLLFCLMKNIKNKERKRSMTRLTKLVERVGEDLDFFLNDKSMTNDQAFKEIGAKLYEIDGLTWKGGFVVKIAEQLILENIEEENICQ